MNAIVDGVRDDLLQAIHKDQLTLPTLPEIALKVREVAEDENVNTASLAAVIGADAAISARLIRVCNSPLLRGREPIDDLTRAVSRLGVSHTANLAVGLAMEQMFQATSDAIDSRMRQIWSSSTEIAGICHVLAKHYTSLRPDQAMLAGLTHRLGVLPILTYAQDNDHLLDDLEQLDSVIESLHPQIGETILKSWDFPPEMVAVPAGCVDLGRDIPQADYVDVVIVAHLQSRQGTDHPCTRLDWTSISAFDRLGLDPGGDDDEDLEAEMAAAMEMLNG